jgi:hypothetical protein
MARASYFAQAAIMARSSNEAEQILVTEKKSDPPPPPPPPKIVADASIKCQQENVFKTWFSYFGEN